MEIDNAGAVCKRCGINPPMKTDDPELCWLDALCYACKVSVLQRLLKILEEVDRQKCAVCGRKFDTTKVAPGANLCEECAKSFEPFLDEPEETPFEGGHE